jgi:trimeric autotransporter adhesin
MTIATDRATALGATTDDLGQAGLIFNDAVRLSEGGLWSTPADSSNQLNSASMYEADISILKADIASALANGATVNGVAVTPSSATTLTDIQTHLNELAAAAPNAVGNSAAAIAAQGVIHTAQQAILTDIANDTNLQNALAQNGVTNPGTGATDQGFQALPTHAADDSAALATATAGASLNDIGAVFNAAANLATGGLNTSNLAEFNTDMKAVAAGLQNFINNGGLAEIQANSAAEHALAQAEGISDSAAQALTGIHLQTALNQIELQINDFDATYAANPNVAARATSDNLLDIIDIIQNDQALAKSAGNPTATAADFAAGTFVPSHDGGFASQAGFLEGTITHFQDNQAQTDFWSAFIAGANNINNALTAEANGTAHLDSAGLNALIQQVQGYEQLGASFDGAQGGVFGARFDNELLGGTLKTDTNTALQALHDILNNGGTVSATDAAQLVAAGDGFVGDAQDVSGNNIPNGGGSYVGTATTVADATTTHIADANSPTSGNVDGNDKPTNNPVNGLTNNGFGVTDPAPSPAQGNGGNGNGGTGNGGNGTGGNGNNGNNGHHHHDPGPVASDCGNDHGHNFGNHHHFELMWHHG